MIPKLIWIVAITQRPVMRCLISRSASATSPEALGELGARPIVLPRRIRHGHGL
jgi:hypothetical protein